MQLKRYELRLYAHYNGLEGHSHLVSYIPFETEQQAQDYYNEHLDEMQSDWNLYLVTLTPNSDHAELVKVMKPTIKKENLHYIGHMRGIDQYEVFNVPCLKMAVVLKCGDKYYLSFAECEEKYNLNIDIRIHNAYNRNKLGMDTDALGREVTICE